jgi:adenylate cyclase, class 2
MKTEIEAKFLDIDPTVFRQKLKDTGATMIFPERAMRRKNFDFPDFRLEKTGGWVRVRDEGDGKIMLAYKQFIEHSATGTKEIETKVENFDVACEIFEAIGMKIKSYQETKREKWIFGDVEIVIDTWPWIPPFVEIEAPTEEALRGVAAKLGFDWAEAAYSSVLTSYQKYFDVTAKEINYCPAIMFSPVPEWLEGKRRK